VASRGMSALDTSMTEPSSGTPATTHGTPGLILVPGQRQRLSDQLYGQILNQILTGKLREGDRLPAEKEICVMFGVSRPVVRQALMRLRADGLVHARQGSGSFVTSRPLARLAEFASAEQVSMLLRCIEVRLPLEGAAARLAADRRTPAQLAAIAAAHAAFEAEIESGQMTPATDLAFHTRIADAAGNELFLTLLQNIEDTVTSFMRLSLSLTRTGSAERARRVLSEHAAILDAIRAQDAETAQIAMQFHISAARRRMVDRNRDR
jgi:GntR family transcriptional regulator, transcriptional repressor for pyruvate dehydrogenase complex